MHISVPVENTMEFINATQVSPLISRVQIKVCYVGQDPNRNGTVITKEVATKFGQNLPGCPIVGYYNEKTGDFEAHNREIIVDNGKYKLVDMTKPYGFVDVGAKVWFQKFEDEGVEHEYLCTEGYLWTEIYEESKRVTEKGNNQSMELNEKYEKGFWAEDSNSGKDVFIFSDGLIEKLCILGSDVEPCFEGSQIKSFAFVPNFEKFKATMFSMINELKDALNQGGSEQTMEKENTTPQLEEEITPTPENTEFEKKDDKKDKEKEKEQENKEGLDKKEPDDKKDEEDEKDEKKKKNYELSDIAEYVTLQLQYSELQNKYSQLATEHKTLLGEVEELRTFKLKANRKEKEDMIASFYMLSDQDKKDVVDNIDTYSLQDIEAKLSIICVRNRVDFSMAENQGNNAKQQYTLNLQNQEQETDNAPEWIHRVREKSN